MNRIKKFEGSIPTEEFILGLLHASKTNKLGEIWEKCVACPECFFKKQCQEMTEIFDEMVPPVNPPCRDVVSLLLGEISVGELK